MKILGIDIHLPTKQEKFLIQFSLVFYGVIVTLLYFIGHALGDDTPYLNMIGAILLGTFLNACGISVVKHGWRAILLILIIYGILYLSFYMLNLF